MLLELDMALRAIFCLLSVLCLVSGTRIYELKCWTQSNEWFYARSELLFKAIDDTVECINKCRKFKSCRIVNIDTKGKCWYRANREAMRTLNGINRKNFKAADAVTNYRYDGTCGEITRGADLNCWAVDAHSKAKSLTQIDRKTVAECLSECKSRGPICWEVNWNVETSPSCWIQTIDAKEFIFEPTTSVTSFTGNRDCLKLIADLDLSFWRVSARTEYASPDLVQVDKSDLQSCLNYCQSNENCTMVEFDQTTKPPCWAQKDRFQIFRGKLIESPSRHNFLFLRKEYEASHTGTK